MNLRASRFEPPRGYARVKVVNSFDELVTTGFGEGVNALCWERSLAGDFAEVVAQVSFTEDIVSLDESSLKSLPLSAAGRLAADTVLDDQRRLSALGLSPVIECLRRYPRDESGDVVPTDVYSFHADSATVETDTYLCTYVGAASEGLRNDEALRCVDIPRTRAELLKRFGGSDGEEFREYLRENCYDLHYVPAENAQPYSFGLGNLWRIAVQYPGCPVPPCVHRAPKTIPGQSPRLLLIS